jgi:hypothetical protein
MNIRISGNIDQVERIAKLFPSRAESIPAVSLPQNHCSTSLLMTEQLQLGCNEWRASLKCSEIGIAESK